MKKIRYIFEAVLLGFLFIIFKIMPPAAASAAGGHIGRMIGPRLAASRKAKRQIETVMPNENADAILSGMWENLGRLVAEYPHLRTIAKHRTKIENTAILETLFKQDKPVIFFSAHIANWEIPAMALWEQMGQACDITYRAPNNPYVDRLLLRLRRSRGDIVAHAKSREGAQTMLKALRNRQSMAFLIDQKYNEGLPVPFFGIDAMTNPVFVQFARKFDYPIIPVQIVREKDCHFVIKIHPPLEDDKEKPLEDILQRANLYIETWVKENPAQWLWLHRRWGEKI